MHPELERERFGFIPPGCQLYDLHSDAQASGEQALLCVPAVVLVCSQVHLFLIWGSDFESEPRADCRSQDDIMTIIGIHHRL